MLPENITAIIARNERWSGEAASEPYEAGWAREAVFFLRALKAPIGRPGKAFVEISPDGMRWVREGTEFDMPSEIDGLAAARIAHFGNWLRVAARFEDGAECTVLLTLHLKA
ncbi:MULTISPECIES: hypothetical protein [unclassified Rhizobium]|jgi:hypothetical protein|uniref:hypothetical protein n=1 Tax=unclassified Rhizobium TaxID=2613769 RepID=UPI000BA86B33|nr:MULTISPECIES: hypothetical protein [unclassified Rhizobium]ASW09819.1 hypothetical protein CKA34_27735 [Rhizobium sp. 11515TR]MDK4715936.1 hypothetical protein [Rhizobium sp. CNPSo 4039]